MTKIMIIKLITYYSLQYGIDPKVALSVAQIESRFNPNAIGSTFDIGVFQLNPKSFPKYTQKQLLDPKINIELGIKYLAKMQKECKHKEDINWLTCYNMGAKKAKTIRYPNLFPYIKKVKLAMLKTYDESL